MNNRRDFILKSAALLIAGAGTRLFGNSLFARSGQADPLATVHPLLLHGTFSLGRLPYGYDALEPFIDKQTMEIHYSRHHQGYVNGLNKAINDINDHSHAPVDAYCRAISKYPEALRNNAGGHYNHTMFWNIMKPKADKEPSGKLAEAISASFGSFANFRELFKTAALSRFGSGWAWLVINQGKLEIGSTPNQDNPIMDISTFKGTPVLCIDVWEHAYYLKYQNKRTEYIDAWFEVINWDEVARLLSVAR